MAGALAAQDAAEFIIDGEVVAFADGQTRFAQLQQRMQVGPAAAELLRAVPVQYCVFDVSVRGETDWAAATAGAQGAAARPAGVRRPAALHRAPDPDGEAYYAQACRDGWEGVIAKRADAPYTSRPPATG